MSIILVKTENDCLWIHQIIKALVVEVGTEELLH